MIVAHFISVLNLYMIDLFDAFLGILHHKRLTNEQLHLNNNHFNVFAVVHIICWLHEIENKRICFIHTHL